MLMKENLYGIYNLDLSQYVFVEKDPTKNCRVYPNNDYESYGECDQAYVESMLRGIVPIWNTNNISKATRNSSIQKKEKGSFYEFAEGLADSPCKLPCTSTKATAQLAIQMENNHAGIRVAEMRRYHLLCID